MMKSLTEIYGIKSEAKSEDKGFDYGHQVELLEKSVDSLRMVTSDLSQALHYEQKHGATGEEGEGDYEHFYGQARELLNSLEGQLDAVRAMKDMAD